MYIIGQPDRSVGTADAPLYVPCNTVFEWVRTHIISDLGASLRNPLREDPIMTQYMLSVFHDAGVQDAGDAYQDEESMQAAFAAVAEFNESLESTNQLVFACGLMPPESASVVDGTQTPPKNDSGPLQTSGAALGGFWVIDAASDQEALDIAARGSAACGQRLEVRPLQGE